MTIAAVNFEIILYPIQHECGYCNLSVLYRIQLARVKAVFISSTSRVLFIACLTIQRGR